MPKVRKAGTPPSRCKVTITLDGALARRLSTYARYHGRSMGDVVSDGLVSTMRGFSVVQRSARIEEDAGGEPERELIGPPDLRVMTGT